MLGILSETRDLEIWWEEIAVQDKCNTGKLFAIEKAISEMWNRNRLNGKQR